MPRRTLTLVPPVASAPGSTDAASWPDLDIDLDSISDPDEGFVYVEGSQSDGEFTKRDTLNAEPASKI